MLRLRAGNSPTEAEWSVVFIRTVDPTEFDRRMDPGNRGGGSDHRHGRSGVFAFGVIQEPGDQGVTVSDAIAVCVGANAAHGLLWSAIHIEGFQCEGSAVFALNPEFGGGAIGLIEIQG